MCKRTKGNDIAPVSYLFYTHRHPPLPTEWQIQTPSNSVLKQLPALSALKCSISLSFWHLPWLFLWSSWNDSAHFFITFSTLSEQTSWYLHLFCPALVCRATVYLVFAYSFSSLWSAIERCLCVQRRSMRSSDRTMRLTSLGNESTTDSVCWDVMYNQPVGWKVEVTVKKYRSLFPRVVFFAGECFALCSCTLGCPLIRQHLFLYAGTSSCEDIVHRCLMEGCRVCFADCGISMEEQNYGSNIRWKSDVWGGWCLCEEERYSDQI